MKNMSLSVVIPAYNEEETIRDCVMDVLSMYPLAEVIVVNDKSTDKTYQILRSLQKSQSRIHIMTNRKNLGHGPSVIQGLAMAATRSDWVLYIDADRQIDLIDLRRYVDCDVVSGYRVNRQDKPFRKIVSFGLKMTNLLWHRKYIRDANCPFKLYNAWFLRRTINFLPDTAIVPIACLEVMARKYKWRAKEIPVLHHKYHTVRRGMLQTLNSKSIKFIWDAFKEITSL